MMSEVIDWEKSKLEKTIVIQKGISEEVSKKK